MCQGEWWWRLRWWCNVAELESWACDCRLAEAAVRHWRQHEIAQVFHGLYTRSLPHCTLWHTLFTEIAARCQHAALSPWSMQPFSVNACSTACERAITNCILLSDYAITTARMTAAHVATLCLSAICLLQTTFSPRKIVDSRLLCTPAVALGLDYMPLAPKNYNTRSALSK